MVSLAITREKVVKCVSCEKRIQTEIEKIGAICDNCLLRIGEIG